ncbi:MAG: T9SS type A sorting domain-containing protein, partial [Bacteroidia bacterium]|nr:T9SS type A sorting domain-containing protein [Bacteroidia bacterium]
MKKFYVLLVTIAFVIPSFGQIINEFQPNPVGTDPANVSFELKGTPSASFSGWIISIENDGINGLVDRAAAVSGTFDGNGLLVVSVPDLENPSFTVVLTDNFTGAAGSTDIDTNNDGVPDDLSAFGTILDAIGSPDSSGDATTMYGTQLGGTDFAFLGSEPQLAFRDGSSDDWYAIGQADSTIYDLSGSILSSGNFDTDPLLGTTFGSINPIYTPPSGPTLQTTGGPVGGLNYVVGSGPSNEGTFTVEGINLTADIVVSAPANFEISETSGGTFGSSINLSDGGTGTIGTTPIYIRLVESLSVNSYSGDVDVTSTGATPLTVAVSGDVVNPPTNAIIITGVFDVQDGSAPKGVELYATQNIADLSVFGVGSANNGGGTDGEEFTFPVASATAGQFIYIVGTGQVADFTTFFGFAPDYESGAMFINGDDAIELFENGQVIDIFGDIDCDPNATSSPCPEWEYTDGWAYRNDATGPDGLTFALANWMFSGVGTLDGIPGNGDSTSPFPIGTYSETLSLESFDVSSFKLFPNPNNSGQLQIIGSPGIDAQVEIFDLLGKRLIQTNLDDQNINIQSLQSGMYLVKISQGSASTTKK